MKTTGIIGALALLLAAGSTHAQSFIPGNQVDEFGPSTYSNPTAVEQKGGSASYTYWMNTGISVPERNRRALDVPEGGQEELGAAGAEPGSEAKAESRAEEKAGLKAHAREQFLQSVWAPNP